MIITLIPTKLDKLALNPIQGINNVKALPTNRGIQFQKAKPMTMHNYPLTKKTKYKIYGYKYRDKSNMIIKDPYWLTVEIATGKKLTPQSVGLDGFFDVKPISQTGVISPKKEKDIAFSDIPETTMDKNDKFIYSKNIINSRGYIQQDALR